MRLNRYIAQTTGLSRRSADALIEAGEVVLNGATATLGQSVSDGDTVLVSGKPAQLQAHQTIMLHKPVGIVSSRRQQGDTPTIYSLLPAELHRLKPAGRLDKHSSGLMILTSDGDLSQRLAHPSSGKWKRYEVQLNRPLSASDTAQIQKGVKLDDGMSHLTVKPIRGAYEVLLQEGRNRQIRRTFATLGYQVTKLHRTTMGALALGDLKPGAWRDISSEAMAL